jgi:DNA-binding winged helix-turn-helix (wHTH) protein
MDLLVYLAERPGTVASREELEAALWSGTVVGYDAVNAAVLKLRRALADQARAPRIIETVPNKGYRLVAQVLPPHRPPGPPAAMSRPWRLRQPPGPGSASPPWSC